METGEARGAGGSARHASRRNRHRAGRRSHAPGYGNRRHRDRERGGDEDDDGGDDRGEEGDDRGEEGEEGEEGQGREKEGGVREGIARRGAQGVRRQCSVLLAFVPGLQASNSEVPAVGFDSCGSRRDDERRRGRGRVVARRVHRSERRERHQTVASRGSRRRQQHADDVRQAQVGIGGGQGARLSPREPVPRTAVPAEGGQEPEPLCQTGDWVEPRCRWPARPDRPYSVVHGRRWRHRRLPGICRVWMPPPGGT